MKLSGDGVLTVFNTHRPVGSCEIYTCPEMFGNEIFKADERRLTFQYNSVARQY